ncbi:ADP-forming succinate--CoA ligase subunit beta [Haloferax mediterranei ATCC 33500]|uniref:Succinate--CoA ligase [ADP-forming] subunit beta n=1 Tax=Haloferax mediterranei (strain ATCC 33500 / DSM 1411 / JCM 8866 / NBRC 14739 / NCIMB 2177 / R-4) TaxID=523841 RepID=I3R7E5_HALMT|nr:ADP-forming succinate--CoA ligase subunit beta [Haloferax mediterranei]AFK20155.1 succinate--CoA ligase beta subunit (ADP-forming) [Haloferax mediterranei ATCC 33500]AHZ23529.1 succinyl-CoA synthetase subunit beta [Haloferax mediterranei ATCC 33500]ELZ99704.1 succinyl-CoA synthetase subunit beta [Haloferax mediterranei ATCC 33500]MDX5987092.1 ADP-forming succinate--CoA ligase subunit beta [Haloferax mediterranei ATCC 33500]QCQ76406.1 ADP-forming succinate--CoA ligase subunit beta [Haloferax
MKLHEYQAKEIFAEAGIPVPESRLASSVEEVMEAVEDIGYPAAIKAQVHVGGRGKAGGIKIAMDEDEARQAAEDILGMDLKGYTVEKVLVEAGVDFENELYVGITMDRSEGKPVAMVSTEGGVNIEEVAEETPEAIAREHIDPAFGLHPYQARKIVFEAGIPRDVAFDVASFLSTLYDLYEANDASDIEINPVMITSDRDVVAADAVMNIDDDALFRHEDLAAMEEDSYEDELEAKAGEYGFDYVRLSGNVGIIGNGAGLVMTTLDLVDYFGGSPANFLDIGGGAKAERVANALDMVFSDENVDSVVFNIFGGITRGDEVAKGINEALEQFDEIPKPVVVRLAGTNAEEGMEILNTELVQVEGTLENAVQRAVENAQEVSQ